MKTLENVEGWREASGRERGVWGGGVEGFGVRSAGEGRDGGFWWG